MISEWFFDISHGWMTYFHYSSQDLRRFKPTDVRNCQCVSDDVIRVIDDLHLSPVSTTRVDGPSERPELTGDRFPLPVNTGRVDG